MSSVEQELAALERISSRLQSTANDSLSRVLSSLLPKLIPLANQAPLRTKVVEIITEALRRAKLSGCKLNLEVFTGLIQRDQMPYACNFGFAFLDAICDANNIENVNERTVLPLLHAVESYPLFSYQSNAALYYCLLYITHISTALALIDNDMRKQTLINILGEYLLDFMLLQSVPVESNAVGAVYPGLSERRIARFTFKKKQLQIVGLRTLKLNALESLLTDALSNSYYSTLLPLIGMGDGDREVVSKSIQVMNRLKELPQSPQPTKPKLSVLSNILSTAFGMSIQIESNTFERIDRTPLRSEVLINILDILNRNLTSYGAIQPALINAISQSIVSVTNGEELLSHWMEFLLTCLNTFPSLPSQSTELVPSLATTVQKTIEKFAMPSSAVSMSLEQSNAAIKYRGNCFKLLQKLMSIQSNLFSENMNLLAILLEIAERDDLSSGTALFAILDNYKDIFQINHNEMRSSEIPPTINNHLTKLRLSNKASCRLLYLHWIHKFCHWHVVVIQAMTDLAEDLVDIVSNHAKRLFEQLQDYIVEHSQEATSILQHLSTVFTNWEYAAYLQSRVSSGIMLVVSSMTLCIKLQNAEKDNQQYFRDVLVYDAVSKVSEALSGQNTLYDDNTLSEIAKRLLYCISTSDTMTVCNENLHYFLDENWAVIDELYDLTNREETILIHSENFMFVLNCTNLFWNFYKNMKTSERLREFEDSLFLLLHRPEKVIRFTAVKSLSLLTAAVQRSITDKACNLVLKKLFSMVSDASNTVAISGALVSLSIYASLTSSGVKNDLIIEILPSFYQDKLSALMESISSANDISLKILIAEVMEATGVVMYRREDFRLVMGQTKELMTSFLLDFDRILAVPSWMLSTLLTTITRTLCNDADRSNEILGFLLDKRLISKCSRVNAFNIGSLIVSLTMRNLASSEGLIPVYLRVLKTLDELSEGTESAMKINYSVIAVVVFFHIRTLCSIVPFHLFERSLNVGLQYMRQSDVFIQDISSLHLSYLYEFSFKAQTEPNYTEIEGLKKFSTLGDFLAHELTVTITRKKRALQPAGFDSVGRGNNSSNATESQDNGPTQIPRLDINLPDSTDRDEVLEAAAAIAAAQLNASLEGDNRRERPQDGHSGADGYGAYSKVCAIARKSGDSAVVMQAIQLVRCDVSFGMGDSTLAFLQYRHPKVTISQSKIPVLIPMLFVAKFDPISSVRDIMKAVWLKVVGNQESMWINRCAREILAYAAANLLNPYWREREAACLCLEDLLNHQSWDVMKDEMADLLTKGLKVMDDLRESTRKVAIVLMKILLQHVLRAVNPAESDETVCREGLDMLLPILLDKGLVSASLEARGFSLGTLIKVVETSRSMIIPWITKLIDVLIESISALEPQMLNYIQFHTATIQVGTEEWEKARVEVSKNSPMHEALRSCLQLVPLEMLPTISNIAYFHLQSGVGLATRVAAADAISFLVEKFPSGMGSYGGKSLKAICTILLERPYLEMTLRKAMLNTLGMLSKVVNEIILTDECEELLVKYFSLLYDRTSDHELSVSNCLQHIIQRAGERMKESFTWVEILTASYIGSFEDDKNAAHSWSETFTTALDSSGVGTRSAAIHKCLPAMAIILPRMLLHPSWDKRKQVTRIIKEIVNNVKTIELDGMFGLIICSLLLTLPGAIWTGQDQILECLGELLPRFSEECLSTQPSDSDAVLTIELTSSNDPNIILPLGVLVLTNPSRDMELIRNWQKTIDSFLSSFGHREYVLQGKAFPRWRLQSKLLFQLFLRELQRGDMDYKVNSANALSRLPWKRMAEHDSRLIQYVFPLMCECADLFPIKDVSNNASNTPVTAQAMKPAISTSQTALNDKRKNAATAMFGNRYGVLPTSGGRQRVANVKIDSNSTTSTPLVPSRRSINENSTLDVIDENSRSDLHQSEQQQCNKRSTSDGENVTATAAKIIIPAVRMYLLECLTTICSFEISSSCVHNEELTSFRHRTFPHLLGLIEKSFFGEVWSIKRAILRFAASLSYNEGLIEQDIGKIVRIAIMGSEEPKFAAVKVASLECLEVLMQSRYRHIVKDKFLESTRVVVRSASIDTQPTVLEAASRVQNLLLSL